MQQRQTWQIKFATATMTGLKLRMGKNCLVRKAKNARYFKGTKKNRHVDIAVKQKLGWIQKFLKSEYNS